MIRMHSWCLVYDLVWFCSLALVELGVGEKRGGGVQIGGMCTWNGSGIDSREQIKCEIS
jgi:hypothetical protein